MRAAAAALALALLAGTAVGEPAEGRFGLGVQTHFEQGWDPALAARAKELGATLLRDEISWSAGETAPGRYDFSAADRYMTVIAGLGLGLDLVTFDGNPLYDGGQTPHTAGGRAAYAAWLAALLDRYRGTIRALEIGNEVNSLEFARGPFNDDPARSLAALVRAVRAATAASGVPILCAGTNTLGLGFLRDFFRHGGLEACDAISVHPYREHPETLDIELDRLRALMREMGGEKPVVATEFGKWVDDPAEAPPFLLKMVAVMGAAGVQGADWYALTDEPWWPNMGLLDADGAEKPAAAAFRLVQDRLLPLGRPVQRGSRTARVYEFGTGGRGFVLWGAGVPKVTGDAEVLDAAGQPVPLPERLTDTPVVVLGEGLAVAVGQDPPVHDSLYEYGMAPWSYFARRPAAGLTPLEVIDGPWTSFRGAPDLSPLRIDDDTITTARFADGPFSAVERFTAAAAGRYRITGWWQGAGEGEPSRILIRQGGAVLAEGVASATRFAPQPLEARLEAGGTLEFEVAPGGPNGDGTVRRRIRVEGPLPGG